MFRHPTWAVGSYSSGQPAARTAGTKSRGRFYREDVSPCRFIAADCLPRMTPWYVVWTGCRYLSRRCVDPSQGREEVCGGEEEESGEKCEKCFTYRRRRRSHSCGESSMSMSSPFQGLFQWCCQRVEVRTHVSHIFDILRPSFT